MPTLIDAKGKACPIPVIMAKDAITAGESSFTVEVDNQTAVENLKRLAANQGFTLSVQEQGDIFALHFSKAGSASAPVPLPTPSAGDYTVFVGRDIIGAGDRELGGNLMRMFFYTLAGSDSLPRSILFMNAGVKLPALDEQIVTHLNALVSRGVEVLVCGTCLNFYGISEALKVGVVSNMYDILSQMQSAAKVISL